jgi:hypothetical protein
LGKWIRIFHSTVPIPITFSASFGLREGSRLHLAPIVVGRPDKGGDAEVIISPIPTASWRSVCRLSVRLHDTPHALATAAAFLRERGINVLLTEAAATFQERAHWDAVCDLAAHPGFAPLRNLQYESYEPRMRELLANLSTELAYWAGSAANRDVFLAGRDKHADFSVLSGLNIASFSTSQTSNFTASFREGGIELPDALEREVLNLIEGSGYFVAPIPSHALITGNTEQRYLRLYFIRDVRSFVMAEIECDIAKFSAGGVGALGALLEKLPTELNLLHLSVFRGETASAQDAGVVRIIGKWHGHKENELREVVDALEFTDIDGKVHSGAFRLRDFATPNTAHPRVYISYSTDHDEERLRLLRNALIENNFEPVVGTELSEAPEIAGMPVSQDVLSAAITQIPTCVAFVSIQTKRDDFAHADGRFTLPPWLIAEEVFAFSRGVRYLARIRESGVEDPRYNSGVFNYQFTSDADYAKCVIKLMRDLNSVRKNIDFHNALREARKVQYRTRTTSS